MAAHKQNETATSKNTTKENLTTIVAIKIVRRLGLRARPDW